MDDNEKIEMDSDKGSFTEEGWNNPEHNKVPKSTESDLPMTTGTRKGDRKRKSTRYNRYIFPGSGGRTYPHRKIDDKEAQGGKRD